MLAAAPTSCSNPVKETSPTVKAFAPVTVHVTNGFDGPFTVSAAEVPTMVSTFTKEPTTPVTVGSRGVNVSTTVAPSTNGDAELDSDGVIEMLR